MNKFQSNLTKDVSGIKKQRAEIISAAVESEHEEILRELYNKKRQIITELLNLEDLSPENTFSLKPGGENFDAKIWVRKNHQLNLELLEVEVEIKIAEDTKKKWFTAEENENTSLSQ